MIRAYCDERFEGSDFYALGAVVGLDQKFRVASAHWKDRCTRSGLFGFRTPDCEAGTGEFVRLSREQRKVVSADITQIFHEAHVTAAGAAIHIPSFEKAKASSAQAAHVLGESPRALCLQTLVVTVCEALRWHKAGVQIAFVFQQQHEEAGAWAREFFDKFKASHHRYIKQLGQLGYARLPDFIPLEMAAAVGYETMKEMLRLFEPKKPKARLEPRGNHHSESHAEKPAEKRMAPRPDHLVLLTERRMLDMVEEETADKREDPFAPRPSIAAATHLRRRPV